MGGYGGGLGRGWKGKMGYGNVVRLGPNDMELREP